MKTDSIVKPSRSFETKLVMSLSMLPEVINSKSAGFILFLAVDARSLSDGDIRDVSRRLLEQGIAYLSVWGPDCERVHDRFDLERNPNEQSHNCIMTTWHDKEPIEKALWSSLVCAFPAESLIAAHRHWIGVSVRDSEWERQIKNAILVHQDEANEEWY